MGNPGISQTAQLTEIDSELLQELMKLASERLAERKRIEKEARDAVIIECQQIIDETNPKIVKLDSKVARVSEEVTKTSCEYAEFEKRLEVLDHDLAEASYNRNRLGKLETKYIAIKAQIDRVKSAIDCLEYIETTIGGGSYEVYARKCAELQRFYRTWQLTSDTEKSQLIDTSEFRLEFKKICWGVDGIQTGSFLSRLRRELKHFPPEERDKQVLGEKLRQLTIQSDALAKSLGELESTKALAAYAQACDNRDEVIDEFGGLKLRLACVQYEYAAICKIRDELVSQRKIATVRLEELTAQVSK
jgi:hypothetical protein